MSERGLTKQQKINRRVKALTAFIKALVDPIASVSVHTFRDVFGGFRVGEISVTVHENKGTGAMGGYSWMRSDVEGGLAVCAAAEDFIITAGFKAWRPGGWDSDLDEHADAKWRLEELIKPEEAPKRKRKKA
jgi:hypothetical protein